MFLSIDKKVVCDIFYEVQKISDILNFVFQKNAM